MTPYTKVYSTLRSLINFILPLLVTCLFYILIYRISRNHGPKFGNNGGYPSAKQPTIDEKKVYLKNIRAARLLQCSSWLSSSAGSHSRISASSQTWSA